MYKGPLCGTDECTGLCSKHSILMDIVHHQMCSLINTLAIQYVRQQQDFEMKRTILQIREIYFHFFGMHTLYLIFPFIFL